MYLFKKTCVHCKTKTRDEFEGVPTCKTCKITILIKREPSYKCPVDGSVMNKSSYNEAIIHRCPLCGGIWSSDKNLAKIEKSMLISRGLSMGITMRRYR